MEENQIYKPRLKEEDYNDYSKSMEQLLLQKEKGEITFEEYKTEESDLDRSLDGKLGPQDRTFFPDIVSLHAYLKMGASKDYADYVVNHELEHGRKAEEMGYKVRYGIFLMRRDPDTPSESLIVYPFCEVLGDPSLKDYRDMKKAPSELSDLDKKGV